MTGEWYKRPPCCDGLALTYLRTPPAQPETSAWPFHCLYDGPDGTAEKGGREDEC